MMWEDWIDRALSCFNRDRDKPSEKADIKRAPSPIYYLDPLDYPDGDDERLEKDFQCFLEELDLSTDKQQELLDQSREKKIAMLSTQNIRSIVDCERLIAVLQSLRDDFPDNLSHEDLSQLQSLVISLRTQGHSFINTFLKLDGLELLNSLLRISTNCEGRERFALFFLCAFRALLNSSNGRSAVLECEESLLNIAASIDSRDSKCKILAVEILSGLCFVPDTGHSTVLKALTECSSRLGERTRFQRLVDSLYRVFPKECETDRVKTAAMGLVNALLRTGPAENSAEYRSHLRYELLLLGIQEIIDNSRVDASQRLDDHFDLFEMMRKEDEMSISGTSEDSGASSPVDFASVVGMAEALQTKLGNTVALPHFVSLLQHLFMVPCDEKHVPLWRLFDLLLQHLTLQTTVNGMTDVHQPITGSVDMNEILSRLHTQCDYEQLEREFERVKEELENEKVRNVELENRLSDLQDGRSTVSRISEMSSSPSDPGPSRPCSSLAGGMLPPVCPPPAPPPPPPSAAQLNGRASMSKDEPQRFVPERRGPTKSLNWTKLNSEKAKGSVWDGIDDEKMFKHIDLDELTTFFSQSGSHRDDDNESIMGSTLGRRSRDAQISVINHQKAQNCTIMLSKLRLSNREIKKALLGMDEKCRIPKDMIEQMLKFVPSKEELHNLSETVERFKTATVLATADRYLYEISQVPRFEQRLQCLHIIRTFKERVEHLTPAIQSVATASTALSSNKRFKQYLSLVLAIGNYLNQGKRSGNAGAFTLQSLNVIPSVRNSTRTDRNLQHYLVQIVERKFPDITRMKRDLACIYEAARFSRSEVSCEIRSLEQAIQFIRAESAMLETMRKDQETPERIDDGKDRFLDIAKEFVASSTSDYNNLEKTFGEMKAQFSQCARLFCMDPMCSPDEFFSILTKFLNSFSECHHQIYQETEEIERTKRQTVARTYFAKKSRKRDKDHDFEQLIYALQNGDLFHDELNRLRTSFRVPSGKKKEKTTGVR